MPTTPLLYPAAVIAAFVYLLLLCCLAVIVRESLAILRADKSRYPVCWLAPDGALWLDAVFSDAYEELTECDD